MINKLAGKYFSYIAKQFPVMCASGSFPLMPPVVEAANWLDRFDDLSQKGISKHITKLTRFRNDFIAAENKATTSNEKAQARALTLSANGVIVELNDIRSWEKSPGLYLQVAFTGLEHAATKPAKSEKVRQKRFLKRLKNIPELLKQAPDNIEAISQSDRALAQTMIRDCARYLAKVGESELGKLGKAPRHLAEILTSLRDFDRFVTSRPEISEPEGPAFAEVTKNILGTDKTAEEIYAMAETEFNLRIESLNWLSSEIDSSSDWKTILKNYEGPNCDDMEARDVIIREIHRLRVFTMNSALPGIFNDSALSIDSQPLHMASTMRPIHYDPALGASNDEPSRCYVSPQIFTGRGYRDDPNKLARLRREFIFLTARQTYPGRHLLDSQRRTLEGSPLSQIINPLFMAGWLVFAEKMLEELGYLENPLDRLVHHHRGVSRAALAMIDAGLAVGNLDQEKCLSILSKAGFSKEESLARVRTIRLAPASRIMPILGSYEISKLRKESNLELGSFCQSLFADGQIPFSFITQSLFKD